MFYRNTIHKWIKLDSEDPIKLEQKASGRGSPSVYDGEAGALLLEMVSEYRFETDFWTTTRMRAVLKGKYRIEVSGMAIHRTLVKHEHSYKKPQKRYFEACKEKQSS